MNAGFLTIFLVMALLASPFLVHQYVARLPWAPTCPSCRAVTREVLSRWSAIAFVPSFASTSLSECGVCGWRGRMKWKWARERFRSRKQPRQG
ncbi:hypothetical protein BH23GEM8_BH23GEM8_23250 [soil metagenome]